MTTLRTRRAAITLAVAVALAAGMQTGVARAQEQLDQQQPDTSRLLQLGVREGWAQTFTAGITGELARVEVVVWSISDGGPLLADLLAVDATGKPTSTVLASATMPRDSVPTGPSFVALPFASRVHVEAGTSYAVAIRTSSLPGVFVVNASVDDVYARGASWNLSSPPFYWSEYPADLAFRTYVIPDDVTAPRSTATPTPATPASVTVTATATFTTATGSTVGSVGPVQCWNSRGVKLALNASDAGSGVASLTYSATGAQPIAATTVTTLPATVNVTAPGVTRVRYAATDRAGNAESPANSETALVGSGYACALPTPTRFAIPTHGSVTIRGTAVSGRYTLPFSTTMKY